MADQRIRALSIRHTNGITPIRDLPVERLATWAAKDQDVLHGQAIEQTVKSEAFRFEVRAHLGNAHLVVWMNGQFRGLFPILQQDQLPIRLERTSYAAQHLLG